MTEFGKVAVLCGGTSAEREISLASGAAVTAAARAIGIDAAAVDVGKNPLEQLQALQFDRAFIALHGPGGEDGTMQALLELLHKPYTGSGVAASALSMDKLRTKQLWRGVSLPTAPSTHIDAHTDWPQLLHDMDGRVVVKPVYEGSSLGISICADVEAGRAAYLDAAAFGRQVMAERFLAGEEFTVALLNGVALPPIRLRSEGEFYDFHAKYRSAATRYFCPAGLPAAEQVELEQLALTAFEAVGGFGWGRIDVMRDEAGAFQLLEANTAPGMTDHSLVPMAAAAAGIEFPQLVEAILQQTLSGERADGRRR